MSRKKEKMTQPPSFAPCSQCLLLLLPRPLLLFRLCPGRTLFLPRPTPTRTKHPDSLTVVPPHPCPDCRNISNDPRQFITTLSHIRAHAQLTQSAPYIDWANAHPAATECALHDGHLAGDLHSSTTSNTCLTCRVKTLTGNLPTRLLNYTRWCDKYHQGPWCPRCPLPDAANEDNQVHWLECPAGEADRAAAYELAVAVVSSALSTLTTGPIPRKRLARQLVDLWFATTSSLQHAAACVVTMAAIDVLRPSGPCLNLPASRVTGLLPSRVSSILFEQVWGAHSTAIYAFYPDLNTRENKEELRVARAARIGLLPPQERARPTVAGLPRKRHTKYDGFVPIYHPTPTSRFPAAT